MREKSKRILKGLGVGTLACVGMIGLTGCAKVEISQDKFDSLVEIAEKADEFMKNQNTNLEKLVEEAKKMTKEEIWNFAKRADYNLMTNSTGLRDNLIATMESIEDDETSVMSILCYNTNDMKVFAELYDGVELWFQTSESNVILADIDKVDEDYVCTDPVDDKGENANFDDCIGVYRGSVFGWNLFDLTYDKFSHYEVLENGNITLTYLDYEYNYENEEKTDYEKFLESYICEYSLDGKLVSFRYGYTLVDTEGDITSHETFLGGKVVFEYGAVDTELVESWVKLAEAKRNEQ